MGRPYLPGIGFSWDEKHHRSDKKEKNNLFYSEGGQTLEVVVQTDCGVSNLGDIQNLTGYGTEQPALVDPTVSRGLDWITSGGPLQSQQLCDSVINH